TKLTVPGLSQSCYRFMGGSVVATAHGAAVLYMYDNDHGTRLVMLTRLMAIDGNTPNETECRRLRRGFHLGRARRRLQLGQARRRCPDRVSRKGSKSLVCDSVSKQGVWTRLFAPLLRRSRDFGCNQAYGVAPVGIRRIKSRIASTSSRAAFGALAARFPNRSSKGMVDRPGSTILAP